MKRCSRCGSENKSGSRFCHNCGSRLDSAKTKNSGGNVFERFRNANIAVKLIIIIVVLFIFFYVVGMIPHIFFGEPMDSFTEESESRYLTDLNAIDMDGDRALSFDEADGYAPEIDQDKLKKIFDNADKNGNGLLKGGEFDSYVYSTQRHVKELEKQKKAEEEALKEKSSSSSIPSIYSGKCPSCGSDESYMYEYYDEFGRPYYECTVCSYRTYDNGEFYE